MPKTSNQKRRILLLQEMLLHETDEEHPISMAEIMQRLRQYDIDADRRSIYDDIEALRQNGLEIKSEKLPTTKYFISEREFELSEIRLLVDCVAASKCLPKKETNELQNKLCSLTSKHMAKQLLKEQPSLNYVKSNNKQIHFTILKALEAIQQQRNMTFNYQYYTVTKEMKFRRLGRRYSVTPYVLFWNSDIYYLFAFDIYKKQFRYYRLDRIREAGLGKYDMRGKDALSGIPVHEFPKMNFAPLHGEVANVTMRFSKQLLNPIIDRFGKSINIRIENNYYLTTVPVILSQQFYAWLLRFGTDLQIVSPNNVVDNFKKLLRDVSKLYES